MGGAPKQRQCVSCGRAYRGTNRRCARCRITERQCEGCGRTFHGLNRRCMSCQARERQCEGCGRTFRGTHERCMSCLARERQCEGCGRTFRGTHERCSSCRCTERQCEGCGRTFHGLNRRCGLCKATERQCEGCGRTFRSTSKRCMSCQATERQCEGCGQTFRGVQSLCGVCWWRTLPPEVVRIRRVAAQAARRALKLAAEVAGPVPPEVYAAVLASGPCVYCGAPARHVDHVRPLSRGGWEHESNLEPACARCNHSKGDRLLTEWRPDRVAYGVAASPKVAAEWTRLQEVVA
jgi:hypothetical protein